MGKILAIHVIVNAIVCNFSVILGINIIIRCRRGYSGPGLTVPNENCADMLQYGWNHSRLSVSKKNSEQINKE